MAPIAGSEPGAPPGASPAIPFARQETPWWCGAASLAMVYGSFGLPASQPAIWTRIAADDHGDRSGVRNHRLALDAIAQGLVAVAFRADDPWEALRRCDAGGVRVVLDLPLRRWATGRHFSVFAGIDGDGIWLHDPLDDGPRYVSQGEFLDLWGWTTGVWDSAAYWLVAIADRSAPGRQPCPSCGLSQPARLPCRRCRRPLPVGITLAHGCLNPACPRCSWRVISCPHCDNALSTHDGCRIDGPFPRDDDMNTPEDIRKLAEAFQAYQEKLAAAQENATDPNVREQAGIIRSEFKKSLDQFSEAMRTMSDRIAAAEAQGREQYERAREKAARAAEERAEAAARAAARRAEKLARAQAKEKAKEVDPHLGAKLRELLLDEFGTRRDVAPPPAGEYGSAIDYWPGS